MPKTKQKPSDTHDEALKGMTSAERILHVAAGGLSLHQQFTAIVTEVQMQAIQRGTPLGGMAVGIPAEVVVTMTQVMGEFVDILKEHGLVSQKQMETYIAKKREEAADDEAGEEKPEGWCEACQQVHEPEEGSPLVGLAGMLAEALRNRVRASQGEEEEGDGTQMPPSPTVH